MKHQKGFTLVELLIVIAIIGILASVVLVTLSVARDKARDAKRFSGFKQVETALELYREANGTYPQMQAYITRGDDDSPPTDVNWSTGLANALNPYLPFPIGDPSMWGYLYRSTNSGQKYGLAIYFDSSTWLDLAAADGGCLPSYYETGLAPPDCGPVEATGWWDKNVDEPINCP